MGIGNLMDAVQKQISTLSHKIDALYQIVDALNYKVSEALSEKLATPVQGVERLPQSAASVRQYAYHNHNRLDTMMEHKDVLVDGKGFDTHHSSEKELPPEIQIQRLTAQLTAAYNRIAALEEQLLAHTFHLK